MLKRIISMLLVIAAVMTFGSAVFAAEADGVTHAPVVVSKKYTVNGGDGKTVPAETLVFDVTAVDGNPDNSMISIASIDTSKTLDITIVFPNYTKMGVYTYRVKEKAGDALGVTYDSSEIEVVVYVVNEKAGEGNADELKVYVGVYTLKDGKHDKKIGGDGYDTSADNTAFTNEYSLGKLTVSKNVTGNLASTTKEFTVTVSFTGGAKAASPITYTVAGGESKTLVFGTDGTASVSIKLKHGDSAVFNNIPAAVKYTVAEDAKHTTGEVNSDEGYTATYANSDNGTTTSGSGTIAAKDEDTVAITNNKGVEIQTGISLDSIPYVLMIIAVLGMAVYIVVRRRRPTED